MSCTHIKSGSYCKICSEKPVKEKKVYKIKKVSNNNTLKCSDGERLSRRNVEQNIKTFKGVYRGAKIIEGKYFCEMCGSGQEPLDISHIVSVDDCYKEGKAEESFNTENMELICRKHHESWETFKVLNPKREAYIKKYFKNLIYKYK